MGSRASPPPPPPGRGPDDRSLAEGIVATIREPLLVLAPDLTVIAANRAFYRVFQVSPAETEGHPLYALGDGQWDIPALRRLLEEILPLNTAFDDFEVTHDFPRIGRRTMLLNARRLYQDPARPQLILLAMEDVTARLEAERARREREEWFRRLADTTSTAIVIYQDERFVYVNRAAEALSGYDREALLRMRFWDLVHPEFRDLVRERGLARQRGEAVPARYEFKIVTREGAERWVDFTAGRIEWNGRPAAVGTAFDITDRHEAEDALRRRVRELEALHRVSAALRSAATLEEALPLLLDETLEVFGTDAGSILLFEPAEGALRVQVARGWLTALRDVPLRPGQGIAGTVMASGQPRRSVAFLDDPSLSPQARAQVPQGWGGAAVPIRTALETVGVLLIAVRQPRVVTDQEMAILSSLAEIAGTALHRMRLHEETARRVSHLQALQTVDRAIAGSLDLHLTLGILLDQVMALLGFDAVGVLLMDTRVGHLVPAAGRGFRGRGYFGGQLRLGEGVAGQAALERRTVLVACPEDAPLFTRSALYEMEGFHAHVAVPLVAKAQIKGVLEGFYRRPFRPTPEWSDLLQALAGQGALAIDNAQLFEETQRTSLELTVAYDETIEGWARALDLRDRETEDHTRRVAEMTVQLARVLEVPEEQIVHLRRGALLHDIGKMGVPDQILLKPGPLTEEEWAQMRRHPELARELLWPIRFLRPAIDIPYGHHERWDGSGYPRGLKSEAIPFAARIFAVADVFDALTSGRPYRGPWPRAQALTYVRDQAGRLFDPRVVEAFLRMYGTAGDRVSPGG
ncbi:MAG TPA: HD domain-containing phosphohydrolase [bacterium]|nr:HD domain-containing phosphohydrolase [bacterium]